MDVDVRHVDGLLSLRQEVIGSGGTGVDVLRRADRILGDLMVAVAAEVARRYEALRQCQRDPEADCSGPARHYEQAVQVRSHLDRTVADAMSSMAVLRGRYEDARIDGSSFLSSLHSHLVAAPLPEVGAGAIGAGGAAAGGAAGSAGSDSGTTSISSYSERGDTLNKHIWDHVKEGKPLSAEDIEMCRGLDEAFAAAPSTREPMVLTRGAPDRILEDLKASGSDLPERIAGNLSLGFRCRHPGYVSASDRDPYADATSRRVHVRLHVPAGTKILDLRSRADGGSGLSSHSWEHEMLLPRDGRIIVRPSSVRAKRVYGILHWHFDADYLPPR